MTLVTDQWELIDCYYTTTGSSGSGLLKMASGEASWPRSVDGLFGTFRPSSSYNPLLIVTQIFTIQAAFYTLLGVGLMMASWHFQGLTYPPNGIWALLFTPRVSMDLGLLRGWINCSIYFLTSTLMYAGLW